MTNDLPESNPYCAYCGGNGGHAGKCIHNPKPEPKGQTMDEIAEAIVHKAMHSGGMPRLVPLFAEALRMVEKRGSSAMRWRLWEAAACHGAITALQIEAGFGDMEKLK